MNAAESAISNRILNVPNALTAARLALSLVLFVLLSLPRPPYLAALLLFAVAASTDWVDGWWARRYGQVTQLGRIFDPFVDKIIICGTFVFLAALPGSGLVAWMAVVVLGRELLVTALRGYLEQQGKDFSASFAGKLKMVFQCAAALASLAQLHWLAAYPGHPLPAWWTWLLAALVWLAILSTIYSGAGYVLRAAELLRGKK